MKCLPLTILPCLLLAACGGGGDEPQGDGGDGRTATGEVLEGSISDAMIPLDQVKSQAPLAKPEAKPTEAGADAAADGTAHAQANTAPGEAATAPTDPIGDAVTGGE